MNIGCHNAHVSEWNSWLGRQTDSVRIFAETAAPGTGAWQTMRTQALNGYQVLVSWKPVGGIPNDADMANITAGGLDSQIIAHAQYCQQAALDAAGAGGEVWISFFHEAENGSVTAPAWVPAANRAYGLLRANAPNCTLYYAYLGGYYRNQFEGRNPATWWPTVNPPDVLGVDYYNWRGGPGVPYAINDNIRPADDLEQPPGLSQGSGTQSDANVAATPSLQQPPGSGVNSWMELAEHFGVPLCFPEFGCAPTQPGNPLGLSQDVGAAGTRAFFQRFADQWKDDPRILVMTYFELSAGESGAQTNWRLSGGPVTPDPLLAPIVDSLSGTVAPPVSGQKVLIID